MLFLYILVPNLFLLLYLLNTKGIPGSDHSFHVGLINRIKENGHHLVTKFGVQVNKDFFSYPQLFHWGLSFFPVKYYELYSHRINLVIRVFQVVSFNAFLFFLDSVLNFENAIFLYANIVVNIFPFSYAHWNAKNSGLSARGVGLFLGEVFVYLLVVYILYGSVTLLFLLFGLLVIIIFTSQFTTQFCLLGLPFVAIVFQRYELLALPFAAFGVFYLISPEVARNYFYGQYNHKRNYALYLCHVFILKSRPSIYRDFIYDFWIKLKQSKTKGLYYIYGNPIVEITYGFIFLWFVLVTGFEESLSRELQVIMYLIFIALALFFLTSFRITRFLGEPQRYLEFVIPLIAITFVLYYDWRYILFLSLLSINIIIVPNSILKKKKVSQPVRIDRDDLLEYLKKETVNHEILCISNDLYLLKFISGLGCMVCRPDYSAYVKDSASFEQIFYKGEHQNISPLTLKEYQANYNPNYLILNDEIYTIDIMIESKEWCKKKQFGSFHLYTKLS